MKNKIILIGFAIATCVILLAGSALAQKSNNGQGSVTLWSCNAGACNGDNTSWALGKCEGAGCAPIPANNTIPGAYSGGQVDSTQTSSTLTNVPIQWQVQVQSFATTATTFKIFGFLDMQNTGTAPAYLGSLVINLQNRQQNKWVTVSSDIVNTTAQDAATTAWTCAGASTDGVTNQYSENGGSGALHLFTPDHNDVLAAYNLQPQLGVNERKVVLYEADFNLDTLHINAGDQIRVEALVTFSNAGSRGGSGASCTNANPSQVPFGSTNINLFEDINGDGTYTADEYYFRTVPCRISFTVPALEHHNQTVTLSDPVTNAADQPVVHPLIVDPITGVDLFDQSAGLTPVNLVGSLTVDTAKTDIGTIDHNGYGNGVATLTSNGAAKTYKANTVQATVDIHPDDTGNALVGLDNCATLVGDAQDDIVALTDPNSTNIYNFTCSTATNLKACAWPLFNVVPPPVSGSACTYSQGGWGTKNNSKGLTPSYYLSTYWSTVYPSGSLTIGGGFTMTFQGGTHAVETCTGNGKNQVCTTQNVPFSGADSVIAYLPAKGTAAALNQSLINPTDSASGVFGGQVLTLQLSVDYGDKGVGWLQTSPVGDVIYKGAGCENGVKVRDILVDANRVLGGGSLPASCSNISALNSVLDSIITAYDGCQTISPAMATSGLVFTSN